VGLRGLHAAPKSWWQYQARPRPNCRCLYCFRLFTSERRTAVFCSDACRQAAHRAEVASKRKLNNCVRYVVILRARREVTDPLKSLRALLDIAGRQFGFKAVQIREQRDDTAA
jgi:hypothetical protein